jgi:hypothetical protein
MTEVLALLGALSALIVAISGLVLAVVKIGDLKIHINSRMDQMLEMQKSVSHAEGIKDEKDRINANQRSEISRQDDKGWEENPARF